MSEHEEINGFKRNVKAMATGVGNREWACTAAGGKGGGGGVGSGVVWRVRGPMTPPYHPLASQRCWT